MTTAPSAPPSPPTPRRRRRWWWLLVLLPLVALALAWGGLQTTRGLDWAAWRLEQATAGLEGFHLRLEGLAGRPPFRVRLAELGLSDSRGEWLTLRDVTLDLEPGPLLLGRLRVSRLAAAQVDFRRLPVVGQSEASQGVVRLPRLAVDRVDLPHVVLGPELVGREMALAAVSDLSLGPTGGGFGLTAKSLPGAPQFLLDARASLADEHLEVKASHGEAAGGPLAGLLGLPPDSPVELKISGQGPVSQWAGRLEAVSPALGILASDLTANWQTPQVALQGELRPETQRLPPSVARLLGPRLGYSADVILDQERLRLPRLTLESAAARLEGSASLGLDAADLRADLRGEVLDALVLGQVVGLELAAPTPLTLTVAGRPKDLEARLEFGAGTVALPGASLADLRLQAQGWWRQGRARLETVAQARSLTLDGGLPEQHQVRCQATAESEDFDQLRLPRLDCASSLARLAGQGEVRLSSGQLRGQAEVDLPRLAPWMSAPVVAQAVPQLRSVDGRLEAQVQAEGRWDGPQLQGRLEAQAQGLKGLPPEAEGLVHGGALTLETTARMVGQEISLADLRVRSGATQLQGQGRMDLAQRTFKGNAQGQVTEVAGITSGQAQGSAQVDIQAAGGVDRFALQAAITSQHLRLAGAPLREVRLGADLRDLPRSAKGPLTLSAATTAGPLEGSATVDADAQRTRVGAIRLTLPANRLQGDLVLDHGSGQMSGEVAGTFHDLEPLGQALGVSLAGKGRLTASLPSGTRQRLAIQGEFTNLGAAGVAAAGLHLRATVDDPWKAPKGEAVAELTRASHGQVRLDHGTLRYTGQGQQGQWNITADGKVREPFHLSLAGELRRLDGDGWRLGLQRVDGQAGGQPLRLTTPGAAAWRGHAWTISPLRLEAGPHHLQVEGHMTSAEVAAHLEGALPLSLAASFLPGAMRGQVQADVRLSGDPREPRVDLQARLADFQTRDRSFGRAVPVGAEISGVVSGGQMVARGSVTGLGEQPLRMTAQGPLLLRLQPWTLEVPEGGVSASLAGPLDLATLGSLPRLDGYAFAGTATMDLRLAGTVREPRLDGTVVIRNGRYEDKFNGTILTNVEARLVGQGRQLTLVELIAADGATGQVRGEGELTLNSQRHFPFRVTATAQRAILVRRELVTATADGTVLLEGNFLAARLSGALTLDPTSVRLPRKLPPELAEVVVIEVGAKSNQEPQGIDGPPFHLAMDLPLTIPGRFQVRGRGLDAEFAGKVTVGGSLQEPAIGGGLKVVRGRYQFLDRSFHLTEGSITLDEKNAGKAYLDIRATADRAEVDARIHLVGPADGFRLVLESSPPLPQDEILALVLFGRPTKRLNPVQAYQLAMGLAELAGRTPGPDILGRTRTILGLDRLDVQDAPRAGAHANAGPRLAAGKYLRDNLYVGIEQDLANGEQDVTVELELTPNLSVNSRAGTASGAGVGIDWRMDY